MISPEKIKFLPLSWAFFLGLTMLSGCVELEFDEPPVAKVTEIEANTTIAQLKARYITGQPPLEIKENVVIQGTVIADDASGNFFKNIVIQDNTGGISVRMNANGLFGTFPIGKKVFVSCNGLFLSDYNGVMQLNGSAENAIEELLISRHVIPAKDAPAPLAPRKVTIDQLSTAMINTLVEIENVQFKSGQTAVPFADAIRRFSLNRDIEDCNGRAIILRSSGYADFAAALTPAGKGSIVAVYNVFGTTKQLNIRDLKDINMSDARCTTGGGSGSGSGGGGASVGTPVAEISETFSTEVNNQAVVKNGWSTIASVGTRVWLARVFSGNTYAQATAYNDTSPSMESWLVSPPLDMKQDKILTFESAMAFWVHDGMSVWAAETYDGKNPNNSNWTRLTATFAGKSSAENAFVGSGEIPLKANGGRLYIGFKYVGNKTNGTTTYRIDNVRVRNK
jgi:hypothetical protein